MIGQTLRSYRILAKLGSGGMGEVFMAEHLRLGRQVAIKVLPASAASDPRAVNRLLSEARAAAALKHPHIVQIYDCDVQDGRPFVAMEYLEGETLAQFLQRRAIVELSLTALIGSQIADALVAAHGKGIVHRDLKPANVFLRRDDEHSGRPWVKLLDFGIAKLLHDSDTPGSLRTRSGDLVGTPAYMAPEQCRGRGEVHTPADIYALGCILFEMVCGRRPFDQEGLGELLSAHLNDSPPDPRQFQPTLPESLRVLILGALSKSPGARPDAVTVREQLLALHGMDPVSPTLRTQALEPPRRRRRAGMVVLLGGAAISALGGVLYQGWRWLAADAPAPERQPPAIVPVPAAASVPDAGELEVPAPAVEAATRSADVRTSPRLLPKRTKRPRPAVRPQAAPEVNPYKALDD